MAAIYLHDHPDFGDLLRIIEQETGIVAGLVEKDYWIMHSLYGLKKQGYIFELKGGTSLSKGFKLINRFSEDIDLHIKPPAELRINENPNNSNAGNIEKKKKYYERLADEIKIDALTAERDIAFDDVNRYNSGGIRLYYKQVNETIPGVKDGILLEAGYAVVTPNVPITISSWAYDKAIMNADIKIKDNRAVDILCYDHRYTFVEKLQTIATKFRKEMKTGAVETNYMRQYYDVYCLLADEAVQDFIGTKQYLIIKEDRFPVDDSKIPINDNEAFLLNDKSLREKFRKRYEDTRALYYKGQPPFDEVLSRIHKFVDRL